MKAKTRISLKKRILSDITILLSGVMFIFSTLSVSAAQVPSGLEKNRIRYGGYYVAGKTGVYITEARVYNAEIRAFISRDTKDLDNRFAYTQNPVNYIDPEGHDGGSAWIGVGVMAILTCVCFGQIFTAKGVAMKIIKGVEFACMAGATTLSGLSVHKSNEISLMQKRATTERDYEMIQSESEKVKTMSEIGNSLFLATMIMSPISMAVEKSMQKAAAKEAFLKNIKPKSIKKAPRGERVLIDLHELEKNVAAPKSNNSPVMRSLIEVPNPENNLMSNKSYLSVQ